MVGMAFGEAELSDGFSNKEVSSTAPNASDPEKIPSG